jgi:acetamidase/formamidase
VKGCELTGLGLHQPLCLIVKVVAHELASPQKVTAAIQSTALNTARPPQRLAVRGAEPGDMLSVTLLDIRPNKQGAAMCIPGWGQLIEHVKSPTTRIFQVDNGVITMNDRGQFPVQPMFGVIGVSPASGDVSTTYLGVARPPRMLPQLV